IFDNAAPFHPGKHGFYDHAGAGDELIEEPILHAQLLTWRFFWAAASALPPAHSPENPCPCPASRWWDSKSGRHRPLSCRVFYRSPSVPDRPLWLYVYWPAPGSFPYAFSFCRWRAPFAARHRWDVGDGAQCRPGPHRGLPQAPGGWWRPGSRRAPAPHRASLRRVARRGASDESNSGSGVGSDQIASRAYFVAYWSPGRRG